ncbi:hypothetical protein, partial [Denitromonas iodatirespirans]
TEMLSSWETASTEAPSGGNSRASALSLNFCPYRATSFSSHRPWVLDSIEATTILTQGEVQAGEVGEFGEHVGDFVVAAAAHVVGEFGEAAGGFGFEAGGVGVEARAARMQRSGIRGQWLIGHHPGFRPSACIRATP